MEGSKKQGAFFQRPTLNQELQNEATKNYGDPHCLF